MVQLQVQVPRDTEGQSLAYAPVVTLQVAAPPSLRTAAADYSKNRLFHRLRILPLGIF